MPRLEYPACVEGYALIDMSDNSAAIRLDGQQRWVMEQEYVKVYTGSTPRNGHSRPENIIVASLLVDGVTYHGVTDDGSSWSALDDLQRRIREGRRHRRADVKVGEEV